MKSYRLECSMNIPFTETPPRQIAVCMKTSDLRFNNRHCGREWHGNMLGFQWLNCSLSVAECLYNMHL